MNTWKLEYLLSFAPILCFALDGNALVTSLHGGLAAQLGLNVNDLVGHPAFKSSQLPIKRNHFRKVMQGRSFTVTLSLRGSSYETFLSPLLKDGVVVGVIGLTTDMTKHLKMEQVLDEERHVQLANQRLNSLAGIASGLAHEINNPLAIISGYAEQLQTLAHRGLLPTDRLVFTTNRIIEACQRCHLIIESLKTFARDGSRDPFELCSINDMMATALHLSEQTFQAKGVALSWTALAQDLSLEGRRLQLIQAIFNVLSNACEAALQDKEPTVSIEVLDQNDRICFHIVDNGPGIPESLRVKIFEPFFSTKEQLRSVGVGLSTTKGMIEEHQGSISFTSSPGSTCFSITLPKFQTRAAESA